MRKASLLLTGLLQVMLLQAQQGPADSLALLPKPAGSLFLHIDKTIYTNNETVWFSAYLLHDTVIAAHKVLSVFVSNDADRKIQVAEKFIIENGLAAGSLVLPDSMQPGHYLLQAYTDLVDKAGKPLVLFTTPIVIKNTAPTLPVKTGSPSAALKPAQAPPANRHISVRFYPEGGQLQQGLPCFVAWEAITERHAPIAVRGILLKDGNPIDTVGTNAYGAGRFPIVPDAKSVYTLSIHAGSYLSHDTAFILPAPAQQGIVLHVAQAVVHDSLSVLLRSTVQQELHLLVQHTQGMYALFKVRASPPQQTIRIP
ncbi:MAG: hypothetical protein JST39_01685, partial [Bacteroidetes bacterium]|nr:hypothetical protein [Bacteroidota bacterium]